MNLLESIRAKTLRYKIQPAPWPELMGARRVLDFGGAFGIHYLQALHTCPNVRWAVVETPEIVNMAPLWTATQLNFTCVSTIADAVAWLGGRPDIIHSNGALHYTSAPAQRLKEFANLGSPLILLYRTLLSPVATVLYPIQTSRFIDHGPGKAKLWDRLFDHRKVVQAQTLIPKTTFDRILHEAGYSVTSPSPDTFICRKSQ